MHIGKHNPNLEYTMIIDNANRIVSETCEENNLGVGLWITHDVKVKHEKQVIAASQRAMTVVRSMKMAFI